MLIRIKINIKITFLSLKLFKKQRLILNCSGAKSLIVVVFKHSANACSLFSLLQKNVKNLRQFYFQGHLIRTDQEEAIYISGPGRRR